MSLPTQTDEWLVDGPSKIDWRLRLNKAVPIPKIGEDEVLVEIKAVSLNFRDVAIAKGTYPRECPYPLVPTSDAAGIILATGSSTTTPPLTPGTRVCLLAHPLHLTGPLTDATLGAAGDGHLPGTLRRHTVVPASWAVPMAAHLSFVEAATLPVAGVTAWNVLFGSGTGSAGGAGPRGIREGDWVLTQGTGAVAMFTAGFAVRVGANVIGTTGSEGKERFLAALGVRRVLNYRVDERWGETARGLTPGGEGVDLVLDVGGEGTLGQSLKAIRYDGTVAVTGYLSSNSEDEGGSVGAGGPRLIEAIFRAANVRGILGGSKVQFEEMMGKIEEWGFRPVVDERTFGFEEVKAAYEYLWRQRHVGKVVIDFEK